MRSPHLALNIGVVFLALAGMAAAQAPANAEKGRTLFQQACAICHAAGLGMPGGQGPSLIGVVGRKAGTVPDAAYTQALKDSGLTWDAASLDRYLANPVAAVPGTNMVVQVANAEDRSAVIAFLATLKSPEPAPGPGRRGRPQIDPNATDPNDWRHQSPGTAHKISADELPAPFHTSAPGNSPQVVKRPADAKLAVPEGFKVELFAEGLENGRIVRVAPNGDIFIAETRANRIRVMQAADGKEPVKIFAAGIRNPVGLGIEPVTGELWTSTNERDGLGDDLVPDYVSSVKEGGYYGWPWYYMGKHEDPRLKGARPDLAGKAIVPDVLLQAHSAALGIAFYTADAGPSVFPADYRGDLFVALHGSWNRNSRTGYKVIRVKLENGKASGSYEDFLTGFVADARGVWGRPVGVAVAHDGALLVTEDGNGTIWRISKTR